LENSRNLPSPSLDKVYANTILGLSRNRYVRSLGFDPFPWQVKILESTHSRKHILGARQVGKSTIVSALPCHRARFFPKSLSIIMGATEPQAREDMEKVKDFISRDPAYPTIMRDSDSLLELSNGSRIVVVPATEKSARGYSSPDIIILDECSRIDDGVYRSGVMPMLTNNQKCELIQISTPHGKSGFFYTASTSDRWERYLVRSPWDVSIDGWGLIAAMPEDDLKILMQIQGVDACYSPRHCIFDEQLGNLEEMGRDMYKQEYCCEFVEPNEQVFSYDEIAAIFSSKKKPLDTGIGKAKPLDFAYNY
jgi:hypothetical protein